MAIAHTPGELAARWRLALLRRDSGSLRAAAAAVPAALLLGVLADVLFYQAAPGVNALLWTGGLTGAVLLLGRRSGNLPGSPQALLLLAALALTAMVALRDSDVLRAFDLAAAALALVLVAAWPAGEERARAAGLQTLLQWTLYGVLAAGAAAGQAAAALASAAPLSASARMQLLTAGRGVGMAAPLLLLFGGLFVAADAVFEAGVTRLADLDVGEVAPHVAWIGGAAWLSCGVLMSVAQGGAPGRLSLEVPEDRRLRPMEAAIVLGSLTLLFAAFVLVQLRYLFGGEDVVERSLSLTYAQYARRGFFELVAACALLLPLLLAFDWARTRTPRSQLVYRWLSLALIVLLFVVMASAVQRMRVYEREYGLTELRLYVLAFLAWLGLVFGLAAWQVLRGAAAPLLLGTVASGAIALAALNLASPDGIIAAHNLERAAGGAAFDIEHALRLSDDAVPALVAGIGRLPPEQRCALARGLLQRRTSGGDPRAWNWGRERAAAALRDNRPLLESACPS